MTAFTGLYVQRLSTGVISGVQVIDDYGNEKSIDPDFYLQRGLQPPIEQLPNETEYHKNHELLYPKPKGSTLKSVLGRVTIAAVMVALLAATLSTIYECYGVAHNSEACVWAKAYFPLTSSLYFIIAWPVCFAIGITFYGMKATDTALEQDAEKHNDA